MIDCAVSVRLWMSFSGWCSWWWRRIQRRPRKS